MNDDWYASLDDWKTRSDMDGIRSVRVCGPCDHGEHDKCWHSPAYDACLCAMRNHEEN